MITDMESKDLTYEIKKRVAIQGQSLFNLVDQFEQNCQESNYFISKEDVKNFVKLMKWNIDNLQLQINEIIKEVTIKTPKDHKDDIEKLKQQLFKQQKINQLMKQEVLQLNQLISDHLKSNEIKLKEKDELIRKLRKQQDNQKTIEVIGNQNKNRQNINKGSSQISIIDEDEPSEKDRKDKKHLEIILEEEEMFSTSRIKHSEPEIKLERDLEPTCIIKYKTQPNQCFEDQTQIFDLDDIKAKSLRKSESKNKAKFFINDFRKVIETQTDNPLCLPSKCSSKFASGESSQSRLSVARNQSQNINIPYRTSTPKKIFTKKKKQQSSSKRPKIKVTNSFFEQRSQKSKLGQRSNSFNLTKQKIVANSRMSSKQKLKDKDMNILNIHLSRPSSKQKLSLTIKPQQIRLRNSQDLSHRIPLKRMVQQEIYLLDLDIGDYSLSLHYNNRSGSSGNGVAFYDNQLKYEGAFKENLRHGFGVLYYKNTQIYKGEWQRDKICGKGRIQNIHLINKIPLPESSIIAQMIYIGEFEENRLHGSGQIVFFSGDRIKTFFHDNRPQGGLQYISKYNQISHSRWYSDN